jgi:hypothetical protein
VAFPKSRRWDVSRSRWSQSRSLLPSRARPCRGQRVRERVVEHLLVDDVGESSLHASHGFHGRADLIFGGSGSDLVFAGRGDDMTRGGPDRDLLLGRSGADTIYGGSNIIGEILIGGRGADTIYDGAGRDNSSGNAGSDVIFGGSLGAASETAGGQTRFTAGWGTTSSSCDGTEPRTP